MKSKSESESQEKKQWRTTRGVSRQQRLSSCPFTLLAAAILLPSIDLAAASNCSVLPVWPTYRKTQHMNKYCWVLLVDLTQIQSAHCLLLSSRLLGNFMGFSTFLPLKTLPFISLCILTLAFHSMMESKQFAYHYTSILSIYVKFKQFSPFVSSFAGNKSNTKHQPIEPLLVRIN